MEDSRSEGTDRFTVLVLIATLAAFLLWLCWELRRASRSAPVAAPRKWQAPGLLAVVPRTPAVGHRGYRDSDNLAARLNLPNMRYEAGERVDVYAAAVRGLATLEPDPERQLK